MKPLWTAVFSVVVSLPVWAQEADVRRTVADFAKSWDKHDAAGVARFYAEDADVARGPGQLLRGRAEIERLHAQEFAAVPKGSALEMEVAAVRMVSAELALVDGMYQLAVHGPETHAEAGTWGSYTMFLRREGDGWKIVAFRPAPDARAVCAATMAGAGAEPGESAGPQEAIERGAAVPGMGMPLTPAERKRIIDRVLGSGEARERFRDHRVRALRVVEEPNPEGEKKRGGLTSRLASVVVFDYAAGDAMRFTYDMTRGAVVRSEVLPGRPQSSEEERQEAARLLRADARLAGLVREGAVIEGGFVVDAPEGAEPRHRYLQFQLLSRSRETILRLAVVDLTAGKVAASWVPES